MSYKNICGTLVFQIFDAEMVRRDDIRSYCYFVRTNKGQKDDARHGLVNGY